MKANAVILYEAGSFDANRRQVMGRQVAGASFLEGLVRHGDIDALHAIAQGENAKANLKADVDRAAKRRTHPGTVSAQIIGQADLTAVSRIGTLFNPDPNLGTHARRRRHIGQRKYSICGITHTVSSHGAIDLIADYLTEPVQPWDALICTSTSVRSAVERTIALQADYLEARLGVRPKNLAQLPVIPLGVDAGKFAALGDDSERRAALRSRLGIEDGDLAVLFFGRLAIHAKAHPYPMLLAMQRAHEKLSRSPNAPRLHFIFTGQFPTEGIAVAMRDMPAVVCPDVPVHFLDGADPDLASGSWAAADLFMSLSDNIQESFGITPIEAMAAGMPCIVSDWDGYKDTVIDGEVGFRAPTTVPPVGGGQVFARSYHLGTSTYDRYIGGASQVTAVSVDAAAEAVAILARDPERLRAMGQAARARAMAKYDWGRIIPAYQELWSELAARRSSADESAPPDSAAPVPNRVDPFLMFHEHATYPLKATKPIRLIDAGALERILSLSTNTFALDFVNGQSFLERIIALLEKRDAYGLPAPNLMECHRELADVGLSILARAVLWLAKYGVVALEDQDQ
jgi:glycosyltransferase involved in cell wall biosynthesis